MINVKMKKANSKLLPILLLFSLNSERALFSQERMKPRYSDITIDVSNFHSSAGQWHHNTGDKFVIVPLKDQEEYKPTQIREIADNILLYQQSNGGWLKNYDMMAVLTEHQKQLLKDSMGELSKQTSFDNGATISQVEYLAKAYTITKDKRYEDAFLKGLNFILSAQYPNGGWPQFYPNSHGYQKYITFNDDLMAGIMRVMMEIVQNKTYYSFVPGELRDKVKKAFEKGLDCILKCQIKEDGKLKAWCQQNDNIDLQPRCARKFELVGLTPGESVEIVELLMKIDHPNYDIINSVKGAVQWFKESEIHGIKVKTIAAPKAVYTYHTTSTDNIVVEDPTAPPIWTRYYELGTNRPFFANKDGNKVYQFSDVARERRTGYTWYGYWPQKLITTEYPEWLKKYHIQ
jgi:PelA/Pel-15E family pectate lyase